ncbi:MAG: hypothetical protein NTY38_22110 [Acidobacteria bacterium]|nr:hypothetical protein [Acidobacteriota bacterium]
MRRFLPLLVCLAACFAQAENQTPAAPYCPKKILVTYNEGPHFNRISEVFPRHWKFIQESLDKRILWLAGVISGTHTALSVYNSEDAAVVEARVKLDPFVMEGVVVYKIDTWGACQLPPAPK